MWQTINNYINNSLRVFRNSHGFVLETRGGPKAYRARSAPLAAVFSPDWPMPGLASRFLWAIRPLRQRHVMDLGQDSRPHSKIEVLRCNEFDPIPLITKFQFKCRAVSTALAGHLRSYSSRDRKPLWVGLSMLVTVLTCFNLGSQSWLTDPKSWCLDVLYRISSVAWLFGAR